ncbi:tetratricopeptide repeat protein [Plectonema cf. radiosum LEGE 06105]|uniref:Tetratricopeptide repeat protein n=1 Tax=Plectonema cf. radiosum LEGE 06105 TaxID=945769 RepID=A0A8J7F6E9_9CYAN|nr:serine/threonine-protein kinase [Plectonema radiosum]MBE9215867.1 tetratricopeptide repeat protein [Plectonema cf. radiosum LEGE 06105]
MLGNTLVGRYQIISNLGGGGFGETFVACDTHLPGSPKCVVKKLKPQATDPVTLETARRLFDTEAKVLYKLGRHEHIPQLLAYFEENQQFYLVQEYIQGHDLNEEIKPGKPISEDQVISLLQEILEILEFVHQQKVIHRDINPRNILRQEKDGKLVLIDFGAVKQITTQVVSTTNQTKFTVAIGTPGYIPSEQAQGEPRFSSDIYALGIIIISAITGLSNEQLEKDDDTNEIVWQKYATVSPEFAEIVDTMVRYDFRVRYSSATQALQALKSLNKPSSRTMVLNIAPLPAKPKPRKKIKVKNVIIKALTAMLLTGIGATASIFIINTINSANAGELYKKANTFYELQRYQDALSNYQKAIEIQPEYAQAWNGKGKVLYELNSYQEALLAYDKAIQIVPDYQESWSGRGFVLNKLQRFQEAISSFDKALTLESEAPEVWNGKGEALSNLKRYEEAIKSYDKAVELQPEYEQAWYNKAWALYSLRRYEDALSTYEKVLQLNPNSERAWYNSGNALVNLNRNNDAIKAYSRAIEYKPNFYQAWLSRGNILISLRRYPEAIESFKEVLKYQPNNYDALYSQGWALHQIQRYEEAVAAYDKAVAVRQNDFKVWYNRGNSLYNLQKYQEAILAYNRAIRYKKDHAESWYSKGNALVNLEQYQEAIISYDTAIKYNPDYSEAVKASKKVQEILEDKEKEKDKDRSSRFWNFWRG